MCFALVDDEPGVLIQIPKIIKEIFDDNITVECYQNPLDFLKNILKKIMTHFFLILICRK